MVLGNLMTAMMLGWMGGYILNWISLGLAVELILFKIVFKMEWRRTLKMFVLMNLATMLAGVALLILGPIVLGMAYAHIILWALVSLAAGFFSAFIHDKVSDFFLPLDNNPFSVRLLTFVNVIGVAIGNISMFFLWIDAWDPLLL